MTRFQECVDALDLHLATCDKCMDMPDGICPEAEKLLNSIPRASGEDDVYGDRDK